MCARITFTDPRNNTSFSWSLKDLIKFAFNPEPSHEIMQFPEGPSAIPAVNKRLVSQFVRFLQKLSVNFNSAITSIYLLPARLKIKKARERNGLTGDYLSKYEDPEKLNEKIKNLERARQSLIEELEAISWYEQRIELTKDESLKKILKHNMDEEKEHAAMLIEWLRKNDPTQNKMFEEHD